MTATAKTSKYVLWSFYDQANAQHRYILSLSMQFGWSKVHKITGKKVADLGALDAWLRGKHKMGQSPVLKPLQDMSPEELSTVIHAMVQMVIKSFSKL